MMNTANQTVCNAKRLSGVWFKLALALCIGAGIVSCTEGVYAQVSSDKPVKKRKAGSAGKVYGAVLDAQTGAFLAGAAVELILPNDIEPPKDSKAATNTSGAYQLMAPLGSSTAKFDAGRILSSSVADLLSGSGRKVEKFINVSQVILRVSRDGYQVFYGVVPLRDVDSEKFSARTVPVYLAPVGAPFRSYSDSKASRYGKVARVTTDPLIPLPGTDAAIQIETDRLVTENREKPKLFALVSCEDQNYYEGVGGGMELKEGALTGKGVFRGKVDIHKDGGPGLYAIKLHSNQIPGWAYFHTVAVGLDDRRLKTVTPLLASLNETEQQLQNGDAPNPAAAEAALNELRLKIVEIWPQATPSLAVKTKWLAGDYAGALTDYRALGGKDPVFEGALLFLTGDYEGAQKRLSKGRGEPFSAGGIYLHKKEPYATLALNIRKNPKDFTSRMALAQYVQGRTAPAVPESGGAGEFAPLYKTLWKIADDGSESIPLDSDGAALGAGRLRIIQGRLDEADKILRPLIEKKPLGTFARSTLADAFYAAQRFDEAYELYRPFLTEKGQAKSLVTFRSKYNSALLLLRKGQYDAAEEMIGYALNSARNEATDNTAAASLVFANGQTYRVQNGPQRISIAGYAHPEAESLALIGENLSCHENPAQDWLRTCILNQSLAEVGLTDEAITFQKQVVAAQPQEPEAQFVLARAYLLAGNRAEAARTAQVALGLNPRDPDIIALNASLADDIKAAEATAVAEASRIAAEAQKQAAEQSAALRVAKPTAPPASKAKPTPPTPTKSQPGKPVGKKPATKSSSAQGSTKPKSGNASKP